MTVRSESGTARPLRTSMRLTSVGSTMQQPRDRRAHAAPSRQERDRIREPRRGPGRAPTNGAFDSLRGRPAEARVGGDRKHCRGVEGARARAAEAQLQHVVAAPCVQSRRRPAPRRRRHASVECTDDSARRRSYHQLGSPTLSGKAPNHRRRRAPAATRSRRPCRWLARRPSRLLPRPPSCAAERHCAAAATSMRLICPPLPRRSSRRPRRICRGDLVESMCQPSSRAPLTRDRCCARARPSARG